MGERNRDKTNFLFVYPDWSFHSAEAISHGEQVCEQQQMAPSEGGK